MKKKVYVICETYIKSIYFICWLKNRNLMGFKWLPSTFLERNKLPFFNFYLKPWDNAESNESTYMYISI